MQTLILPRTPLAFSRLLSDLSMRLLAPVRDRWAHSISSRGRTKEGLRLVGRLNMGPGASIAVVEFEAQRFVVSYAAKGSISITPVATEALADIAQSRRVSRKRGASA